MSNKNQHSRILFGLKVKQLRQKKGLSFADLSELSAMSVSYLNEIEKGKKYPKPDKLSTLAKALGTSPDELNSLEFDEGMAPVIELLKSNFLNELPLELFGVEMSKVVEMIANAPARVGAFISTLLELSRNYAVKEENFYFGALRSYLELHHNYFEDIEEAVRRFVKMYGIPEERPIPPELLKSCLEKHFGYKVIDNGLDRYPELLYLRSVFIPKRGELLLNSRLTPMQRSFQYGKELGFNFLKLQERALTSSLLRGRVFEEVLNHSKSIYFSVALHIPEPGFSASLDQFFKLEQWDPEAFLSVMQRYDATPEMYFHRMTNVLPQVFGMRKLFFLRFVHDPIKDVFDMDKELHLSHRHHPHGNRLDEHYCRRWISLSLLNELKRVQQEGKHPETLVSAQVSHYLNTEDSYLCFTIARPSYPSPHKNVSVTIGLLINEELREKVRFLDDPAIVHRQVHTTCERCPLLDCKERAAEAVIVEKRQQLHRIQERLRELMEPAVKE